MVKIKIRAAKGFSLIELLVVVALIGLLAALLLPALSSAMNRARSAACVNHLHEMGLALQMYVQDNGSHYPGGLWFDKLQPYYAIDWTNTAYHCPGYQGQCTRFEGELPHDALGSYAYNFFGVRGYDPRSAFSNFVSVGLCAVRYEGPGIAQSQIQAPSEMFAIGESRHRGERGVANASGVFASFCGYLDGAPEYYGRPQLPKRHGQNYNQLCCDGHVDGRPPRILFNPTNTAVRWNIDHLAHPEFCPPFE
jgi:prepilin-type N-terminal cleavage/methylation domain-containing protein